MMADITFWGADKEFSHDNEIKIFEKLIDCRAQYVNSVVDLEKDKKIELSRRKSEWDTQLAEYKIKRDSYERSRLEDMNHEIEKFKQKKEERKRDYSYAVRDLDNQIDEVKRKLDVLGKLKRYRDDDAGKLLKAKNVSLTPLLNWKMPNRMRLKPMTTMKFSWWRNTRRALKRLRLQ